MATSLFWPGGSSPLTRGKPAACAAASRSRGLIPAHAGKTRWSRALPSTPRAHPRSRGENRIRMPSCLMLSGSSPLTRGKLKQGLQHGRPEGLIPAHAGKTGSPPRRFSACPAHPRSRGENTLIRADDKKFEGSSPLTRGKHQRAQGPERTRGLIPAHAGKTTAVASKETADRAHPRSRGENRRHIQTHPGETGSSPLTRGKHLSARRCSRGVGLIPAHAGKTRRRTRTLAPCGAHPRSRGENIECRPECDADDGSSPLTRGKRSRAWSPTPTPGLIPAHAGKTPGPPRRPRGRQAHPRSRGENVRPAARGVAYDGSSPLTRGKRQPARLHVRLGGLIPTHAGKTTTGTRTRTPAPAHPHSRGENVVAVISASGVAGSSPLTRGKPAHDAHPHGGGRAHPHSRGENQGLTRDVAGTEGSSPLTRGKHAPGPVPCHTHGLIPTHAGKTPCNPGTPGGARAHPHSRGENTLQSRYAWRRAGSSPLTRGKPAGGAVIPAGAGLIPTHAGKT